MNIRDAYKKSEPRFGRNSDPHRNWWKEERLDGVLIWPKVIDPLTMRPVPRTYRSEIDDGINENS